MKNLCEVLFECGHSSLSGRVAFQAEVPVDWHPTDPHEPAFCLVHGRTRIETVYRQEWRVRCHGTHTDGSDYDCRFSRWCRQSRTRAMRYAKNHCSWKNLDHHVFVAYDSITRDGKGIILASGRRWPADYLVTQARTQGELPIFTVTGTLESSAGRPDLPPPF